MWRVKLITAAGEYVTHVVVPPYTQMPDVIVWGQRLFLREGHSYREAFAVVAWNEAELAKMGMNPGHTWLQDWPAAE